MTLKKKNKKKKPFFSTRQLLLPYTAPYFSYILIASTGSVFLSQTADYLLRIIVSAALLFWAWKWYLNLRGPGSVIRSLVLGIGTGLFGCGLWICALIPFVSETGAPWPLSTFFLRLLAAGFLVPVFEEILMRGYVFRLAWQWDQNRTKGAKAPLMDALDKASINDMVPGQWSWAAVLLSSLVFASGHHVYEWPASILYGLLMSWLWIISKDLLSCIIAHATTNISLAFFVFFTGFWQFW